MVEIVHTNGQDVDFGVGKDDKQKIGQSLVAILINFYQSGRCGMKRGPSFGDVLNEYVGRSAYRPGQLARLTGVPQM